MERVTTLDEIPDLLEHFRDEHHVDTVCVTKHISFWTRIMEKSSVCDLWQIDTMIDPVLRRQQYYHLYSSPKRFRSPKLHPLLLILDGVKICNLDSSTRGRLALFEDYGGKVMIILRGNEERTSFFEDAKFLRIRETPIHYNNCQHDRQHVSGSNVSKM